MAIIGTVSGGWEALIPLDLVGPGESSARIEAVVDTGFTGYLVLSPSLADDLGLPLRGSRDSFLADGSVVSLDAYRVGVEWDGRVRVVSALAADGGPLVGMSLLRGSEVSMKVLDGGEVVIRPVTEA